MFTAKELYESLVSAWPTGAMPMFDNLPHNSRDAWEGLAAHINRPPSPVDVEAKVTRLVDSIGLPASRSWETADILRAWALAELNHWRERSESAAACGFDAAAQERGGRAAAFESVVRQIAALAAVESRQDCGKPDCGYCGHDEADARNGYVHPSTCPDVSAVESRPAPAGEVAPRCKVCRDEGERRSGEGELIGPCESCAAPSLTSEERTILIRAVRALPPFDGDGALLRKLRSTRRTTPPLTPERAREAGRAATRGDAGADGLSAGMTWVARTLAEALIEIGEEPDARVDVLVEQAAKIIRGRTPHDALTEAEACDALQATKSEGQS